jgi:ribosomal protein S12 methylthiotransferase accessory factor
MRNSKPPSPPDREVHKKRDYSAIPDWEEQTLTDDLNRELNSLTACGINRVIVIDLTHEEFQIPVAKVVIPGLEGVIFEADYSPGLRAGRLAKSQ